jgi:hopene-associated glycosyltransferase HpnB
MVALAAVAAVVLAFWLALALDPLRRFPRDRFLETADAAAPVPRVAVLVPARDEAAVLPQTLPSLLRQDYPEYDVVLVDDGSTDGTASVARGLAAAAGEAAVGRFTVVDAGAKPAGWAGKMHALARGVEAVLAASADRGEEPPAWILLTDADIRHPPASVSSLVAKAQRGGYDLVSVMARLSAAGAWERLLIPAFVFFFHLLYPFRAVSRRSGPVAAAAGGCVLVRASALLGAGGFAAIHDALIDDVALARLLKARRRRLWLGLDPEIESVRRYAFGDLWRMVARSAFVQLGYRYWRVPLVALALALFCAGPSAIVVASAVALLAGAGGAAAWAALALGAAARVLETWAILPWVRHHRIRHFMFWSLAFPLAALLYAAMTVDSAWDHLRGQGAAWKGRGYRAE